MKRWICFILCAVMLTALCACTARQRGEEDAVPPTVGETLPDPTTALMTSQSQTARDPDAVYEYETREIWCENNGNRIYGAAYIPIVEGVTQFPLVIHAHGMGSNHEAGAAYLKRYAEKGFAGYTFDFPGGSRPTNENKSDGDPMQNSAVTEASDLQAVLDTALTWDFVDKNLVFLEGGSMGGLVATMTGLDNTDKVKGMILHYPALYMPQIANAYASIEDVPDTLSFGEDYELGSRFVTDIWGLDVVSRLGEFTGPVTIIQGSEDQLVAASSIEEASHYFPNAEFHLIEGSGHGFSGDDFDTAVEIALDYLFANT